MESREETQAISDLMSRMRQRFPEVSHDDVDAVVATIHHQFDGRPIRDFVPVLVERDAVTRLHESENPSRSVPGAV